MADRSILSATWWWYSMLLCVLLLYHCIFHCNKIPFFVNISVHVLFHNTVQIIYIQLLDVQSKTIYYNDLFWSVGNWNPIHSQFVSSIWTTKNTRSDLIYSPRSSDTLAATKNTPMYVLNSNTCQFLCILVWHKLSHRAYICLYVYITISRPIQSYAFAYILQVCIASLE